MGSPTTRERRPHWKVPVIISSAWTAGLLLAIGHYLFYASLDSTLLERTRFSQQVNTAIGTGLAFLVRAALVLAVATSFWQLFWRRLYDRDSQLNVGTVDSTGGMLTSLPDLLSPKTVAASPVLALLALLAWLMPLAAIIPPATLTVELTTVTEAAMRPLRTPDFMGSSMAVTYQQGSDGGMANGPPPGVTVWDVYHQPTNLLTRVAAGVAYGGALARVPAPAVNASYVLDFEAPHVICEATDNSVLSGFGDAMGCDLLANSVSDRTCDTGRAYNYLAWTPSGDSLVPFDNGSMHSEAPALSIDSGSAASYLGSYMADPATLFVGTRANISESWTVLNCSLYNATYTTNFTFTNTEQSLTTLSVEKEAAIPALLQTASRDRYELESDVDVATFNAQALMDALGRLLVGSIESGATSDGLFAGGTMGRADGSLRADWTRVMDTELAYTSEMILIYNQSCATQLTGLCSGEAPSMPASKWYEQPLGKAIEELFQNITLALFSRDDFLRDSDTATNVTISTVAHEYSFDWRRLVLAYGIALVCSLLVTVLGCITIFKYGASYSNVFSSIMRATGGEKISVEIRASDRSAADPLPAYVKRAKLRIQDGAADEEIKAAVAAKSAPLLNERPGLPEREALRRDGYDSS